jgi:hypothetical protein
VSFPSLLLGAILLLLLLLVPGSALAHVGGSGEQAASMWNFVLLLAGIVSVSVGVALKGARTPKWASSTLFVGGIGLALAGLFADIGGSGDRPEARVAVMAPEVASIVPAGQPVKVTAALQGARLATSPQDTEGGHLHLYVDRKLQQMPYSNEATVTLEPGRHELTVEYVDPRHVSYDPPIDDTVVVTAR